MARRCAFWAYQKTVKPILVPEKICFNVFNKTNYVLSRNFRCVYNSNLKSEGERRLNSKQLTSETILDAPNNQMQVMKQKLGSVDDYFNLSPSLVNCETLKEKFKNTMLVYPNFVSPEEEANLLKEIEPYLSRLHYENSHWDDAIHEYRETERSRWNKKNEVIINRIRSVAFPPGVPQLKLVHILDLAKKGVIKPHIDSVRFCGNTIAGLSILSDCVMRLRHDVQKDVFCDVYLPRHSLYVMTEFVRYEFTHEILGESISLFKAKPVARDRRISIICRNEPENSPSPGPVFKVME